MDLKLYRKALEESLNNDISLKENQSICNMLQITDKTIESSIETEIKNSTRVKAEAEAEKAKVEVVRIAAQTEAEKAKNAAEIEKLKAEAKAAKIDALTKVGSLAVSVLGTVIGVGGLIFVNGMNIESHRNEEMKYSDSERDCERTIFTKTLDLFKKK